MKGKGKIFKISSRMSEEEKKKVLETFLATEPSKSRSVSDISKYAGSVKFSMDPIKYQKKTRGEWERNISF